MRAFVTFGIVLMFVSGCSHFQPAQRGVATIEFERQEDNGSVNIVPCTLVLSDHQKITLRGGERAVVSVRPGTLYVTAFSIDPYSPHSSGRAWRSPRMKFQAVSGESLRVIVEPASSGSKYTDGWTIHALRNRGSQLCSTNSRPRRTENRCQVYLVPTQREWQVRGGRLWPQAEHHSAFV